jgi:hypothetical protein
VLLLLYVPVLVKDDLAQIAKTRFEEEAENMAAPTYSSHLSKNCDLDHVRTGSLATSLLCLLAPFDQMSSSWDPN